MKQNALAPCLMGLLMMFSPFRATAQERVASAGRALAAEVRGQWYMIPVAPNSKQKLPVEPVGYVNGHIVLPRALMATGSWLIDEEQGIICSSGEEPYYFYVPKNGTSVLMINEQNVSGWQRREVDGVPAWHFSKWEEERIACIHCMNQVCSAGYAPITYYEDNKSTCVPVMDYPIAEGWYRSYDSGSVYGTFCPSRDVASLAAMSGAEFYTLQGYMTDDNGQKQLVFEGPCTHLEAGMPYLMKRPEGSTTVSLLYSDTEVDQPTAYHGMTGTFTEIPKGRKLTGKYVLAQDRFVQCADGSSLAQNGAYIDLAQVPLLSEEATAASALRFSLPERAGAASIDVVSPEEKCYRVYSLSGRLLLQTNSKDRLSQLKPGVYVVNGRKFLK